MYPHIRCLLPEPTNHDAEPVTANNPGPLLHLPVGTDAQHVFGTVPEFFEVVPKTDRAPLGSAALLGVAADLVQQLTPLRVVQVDDAGLAVIRLLLVASIGGAAPGEPGGPRPRFFVSGLALRVFVVR